MNFFFSFGWRDALKLFGLLWLLISVSATFTTEMEDEDKKEKTTDLVKQEMAEKASSKKREICREEGDDERQVGDISQEENEVENVMGEINDKKQTMEGIENGREDGEGMIDSKGKAKNCGDYQRGGECNELEEVNKAKSNSQVKAGSFRKSELSQENPVAKREKDEEESSTINTGCRFRSHIRCSDLSILRDPAATLLIIFSFFHIGGIMSLRVFLPPLILESLQQEQMQAQIQQTSLTLPQTPSATLDESTLNWRLSRVLMLYGIGGVIGNIFAGLALTFGPFRGKNFQAFVINNILAIIIVGEFCTHFFSLSNM